ncbi:SAM-dependent methyltransferase [Neorhizobium huautlense]|uniref:SAM-dependent methyltransferase n=1 Tax=Neorhizobium huautlense TaxID=67774 RepID=A0ABT9Q1W6_9HYPH|nr:class I SAM-dependent methyltransferase [Neorhizobium huautlense]MDP9840706.1 SAM-dependent methyltransferase [Neorhizobium huautlense]
MKQDGSSSLQFTGERFHPELEGEIRQEHMHRYAWCCDLVAGKDVVDVASGEGFGSDMLASRAKSVIGIDLSAEAIAHAQGRYTRPNLRFQVGDAAAIDLPDSSADVIVSFETIEHIDNQEGAISEFFRVLREDGVLIISSPDIETYSIRQKYDNPFHKKELDREGFTHLLKQHFGAVRLYGQRILMASALLPSDASMDMAEVLVDDGDIKRVTRESPASMYFVAIAARQASLLPSTNASFLLSDKYDVYWQQKENMARREDMMARTEVDLLSHRQALASLRDDFARLRSELITLRAEAGLKNQFEHMHLISNSGLFDPEFYAALRAGANIDGGKLLEDYIVYGEKEGLAPSAEFDPCFYASTYPDVEESGMGLLLHYIVAGRKEGRLPKAAHGPDPHDAGLA